MLCHPGKHQSSGLGYYITNVAAFYSKFPQFYSERNCSSNVHDLIHLVSHVRLWGPLWGFSMFSYENMNGFIRDAFHGTRKILDQLVFHTRLRQSLPYLIYQVCAEESASTFAILESTKRRQNLQQIASNLKRYVNCQQKVIIM